MDNADIGEPTGNVECPKTCSAFQNCDPSVRRNAPERINDRYFSSLLVLLCHKQFEVKQQYGHLFNRLEMWAAIRQRSVAIESGTCRCIRWGTAWDVVRG